MIEINNLTKVPIDKELLKRIAKQILSKEGIQEEVELSAAIVDEREIQKLNRIYRGKDKPTDVLSFVENSHFIFPPSSPKQLGEIVICQSQIKGGKEKGIIKVFVHGLLHLLGYSHEDEKDAKVMEAKQKKYLTLFSQKYDSD